MKYKFTIGEFVIVDPDFDSEHEGFTRGMNIFIGKKLKVLKCFKGTWINQERFASYILDDYIGYSYREDWLKPLYDLPEELFDI